MPLNWRGNDLNGLPQKKLSPKRLRAFSEQLLWNTSVGQTMLDSGIQGLQLRRIKRKITRRLLI
jgi:hypothetical protein